MIGPPEDTGLALECFAQEAADVVAQLWIERARAPLSADQKRGLVDGIWECLFPGDRAEAESEASNLVQST